MAFLKHACERLGLSWVPSWANFLLVRVGNGAQVYERLLRLGVIVRPMGFYGFPDHVRVTIGTAPENERFVHALERALRDRETREQAF
jgi:histidinol-phosphate aminotransferase